MFHSPEEQFVAQTLARADLLTFTRLMFKARRGTLWQRAAHHKVICDALMRVYRGECLRLLINIPPRYSKTELAVINFIAWALGNCPDAEFITTSYSARLASSNSWKTRDMVASLEYQELFPDVKLRDDSQARDEWRTIQGGCIFATGAEGTITGYGAGKLRGGVPRFGGAIIIDDIHKPTEIRHDNARKDVIDWFQGTLESRKNDPPNTPIIAIGQRLHEEDLFGWLLAGGNGEAWEHIDMPALQADGTALWPEKHDLDKLLEMQESAPYTFAGQYQQRPTPPEGGVFKPDALRVMDAMPDSHLVKRRVRAYDFAATEGDGDWTVGLLLAELTDKTFVIEDVVRFRGSPDEVEKNMLSTAQLDGRRVKISIAQDPGAAGKAYALYQIKSLVGYVVHSSPESGDKITRAEPFAAQLNVGHVAMVRADWNLAFVNELRNFPFGKNDDQVDAASRGFNYLTEKRGMSAITPETLAAVAAQGHRG